MADPIDNSSLTSKYKYGSLNRADAQRNRTIKSPVKQSNPFNSIVAVAENQFDPNLTDSTGPYRAVVLRVESSNSFIAPDSQIQKSFFGLFQQGTAVTARILEYHHAAIPMPPSLNDTEGVHNFFIDMHDIFYSKESLSPKVGDIVEVDYRDRKNKKDPLLLKIIADGKLEGDQKQTSPQEASESGGVQTREIPKINYNPANLCRDSKTIIELAKRIGIPPAVMAAFRAVESGGNPSVIRFEPHVFNTKSTTKMPYTNTGVGFSRVASETNKSAFDKAYTINKKAAIESTSWGSYQVMGWALLAVPETGGDPQKAIDLFYKEPDRISQEMAVSWFKANSNAISYAKNLNFAKLARTYNGTYYANNNYDAKLKQAYEKALADCPEYKAVT